MIVELQRYQAGSVNIQPLYHFEVLSTCKTLVFYFVIVGDWRTIESKSINPRLPAFLFSTRQCVQFARIRLAGPMPQVRLSQLAAIRLVHAPGRLARYPRQEEDRLAGPGQS